MYRQQRSGWTRRGSLRGLLVAGALAALALLGHALWPVAILCLLIVTGCLERE